MRFTVFLNHGENTVELVQDVETEYNSKLVVKSASVFWDHENVQTGVNDTITYNTSTITIEPGYWTFDMLKSHLKNVGLILDKIEPQNKCIVQVTSGNTANLKKFGLLLGFPENQSITSISLAKSANKVGINSGIRFLSVASNLVNRSKNFNPSGERSRVIASLPITSTQNLNGTVTKFENVNSSVTLNNGTYKRLHFVVGNNADVETKLKMLLEFEIV